MDWARIWEFMWPIVREGLIALLISLLALLGYDKKVPSRYARFGRETGDAAKSGARRKAA